MCILKIEVPRASTVTVVKADEVRGLNVTRIPGTDLALVIKPTQEVLNDVLSTRDAEALLPSTAAVQ